MKQILKEDLSKFTPTIIQVIATLGKGATRTEVEQDITVGDTVTIANVKGYWIKDSIRIDIKFRS